MKKLIPYVIKGNVLTVDELQQIIEPALSEIEESLIGDLTYFSENAHYETNSLQIVSITQIDKNYYSMTYQFKWTIFNGCLDINADELTKQSVTFRVKPDGLEFDIIESFQGSAAEEL
ncbi:hypothetical protein GRAQ_02433 [Rahnella aquatilis CIP 78.65 = ATCC 33071]|uniref:Uncharacterized protein n=1 Tax=Rahnella aquatilis (strain ATCC 33071 / DSM 4594 / JCM 1683 / NBRC 105701 / NCIMB 13365 / CIP 78.65) TaxID=745277 RepID=H2IYZ1_RAHAC|nr:hypothetical protein Rahaq2_3405 [Rahnella aquatilis CIP 78.65 = ATCC 33071]KFD04085.1 hypothetical protein GRAQ_02433 [Rahnella aquatilis CIP 78.65 = ATCC 33071]